MELEWNSEYESSRSELLKMSITYLPDGSYLVEVTSVIVKDLLMHFKSMTIHTSCHDLSFCCIVYSCKNPISHDSLMYIHRQEERMILPTLKSKSHT